MLCFFRKSLPFRRDRGFSLPEILVVIGILGVLAAIAIPVSMSQQSRASDASIRSDLTNVAAVVEGQLLAWRGAPPDGALNICSGISGDYPPANDPTNTCEEGQWRATRVSNNQVLSPPVEGKLSPGIFVQGRIAADGSYCLDGSSSRSGAKNFYFDSQSSQVQEGTCKSIDWTPTGSLVGSTGATTTPGDLPPPPSGVAVEVPEGGSTATVKWNAQAGVTYIVKVSNEPAKTLTASTTGVVSCVFPAETCESPATGNLMVGTYTAIVRAGNNEGWGAGATQDFKIENAAGGSSSLNRIPPPSQPTVSQSGADINLNWTAPTGLPDGEEIINYRISWSKDGVKWVGVVETGSNDTGFKIPGASFVSGETYFFRIQAMSDSGILGRPSQVSAELNYVVTKPPPPALIYSVPGFGKIDLKWSGNQVYDYLVSVKPDAGSVSTPTCLPDIASNCETTITGLTNGTNYIFTLRSKDSFGVISDSVSISGTPTAVIEPSPPLAFATQLELGNTFRQFTATWKPPLNNGGTPITQYQIQWSVNGLDTSWNDSNSVFVDEKNISFDEATSTYKYVISDSRTPRVGLPASNNYYFRVIAVNTQGFSRPSSVTSYLNINNGLTPERAAGSSLELKQTSDLFNLNLPTGWYHLKLDGSTSLRYWIDMTYQGGGWLAVLSRPINWTFTDNGSSNITYARTTGNTIVSSSNASYASAANPGGTGPFMLGLTSWHLNATKNATMGGNREVVAFVNTSYAPLSGTHARRSKWRWTGWGPAFAWLGLSSLVNEVGGTTPGLYSYHAANGYNWTTNDRDQDVASVNCSHSYNNAPSWYGACWSGNPWGGNGANHANAFFWTSSGGDYWNYGAVYVR
jgi:prepilin-type N-terminal cleavage/methylation domain-containing protein